MAKDAELQQHGYVPGPGIGHELGIMFGFIGAMLLTMLVYVLAWQVGQKRGRRKEQERIEALKASGWLNEKQQETEAEQKEDKDEIPMD